MKQSLKLKVKVIIELSEYNAIITTNTVPSCTVTRTVFTTTAIELCTLCID